mmetsp:Transcript_12558/g.29723  ORF Transcript_12558/g.29723 Transcript_12558/m.29723 type:complete len:110 (-) Transcript_12558:254-583(-)|eukprot:CAMPEP_0197196042 /NCGR_PEP_ID=MMETSP1423-20130617/32143_1 /TAXON_ID=476441 /ORGANISM="Pseudo-nitzschia heimii, Strain UNC1101" /LENGTH=109 /DNA_ID=CAMNT_0042649811 /DNA_START=111 /DNA_END=440 /DNA_ORIENTATION=+
MVQYAKNSSEFDGYLAQTSEGKLMVVDFTAVWCGPCRMIAPHFEELAKKNPDVIFIKVDVDEASDVAEKCKIVAMPTFKFYKNGVEIHEMKGADSNALTRDVTYWKQSA